MKDGRGYKNRAAKKIYVSLQKKWSELDQGIVQIFEAKMNGYSSTACAL